MVVPYCMLHFQKPGLESVGSIIAGGTLAIVALRTRSIFAGMAIHIAVAWTMDWLALWHRGELQKLLGW
jgi:membrane protease YdiL (CAAX protease family)